MSDAWTLPRAMPGQRRRVRLAVELPLLGMLLVFVVPILWMVVLVREPDRAIILPSWQFAFTPANFLALLAPDNPFKAQMLNSVVIVPGTVVLCVGIATLAGYGLARLRLSLWLTMPVTAACTGAATDPADGAPLVSELFVPARNIRC